MENPSQAVLNQMKLPETLIKNIQTSCPEKGPLWLANLPKAIEEVSRLWDLQNIRSCENLSYNFVATCFSTKFNKQVVLKLSVESIRQEAEALQFFAGNGCVQLLDCSTENNALLLEFIQPGKTLKSFFPASDDLALEITVQVIKQLHQKPLENLGHYVTIQDAWLADLFDENIQQLPSGHLAQARKIAKHLLASTQQQVLLHGDLHHENILSSFDNKWLAIDPKGFVGDPVFEPMAFIRNPIDQLDQQPNVAEIVTKRVDRFSNLLNLDRDRIAQWCYVQAVLDAVWAYKDKQPWQKNIIFAQLFTK